MTSLEIKQLLDEKYQEYCHSDFFIHTDPIQIPKLFEEKEDIEIDDIESGLKLYRPEICPVFV